MPAIAPEDDHGIHDRCKHSGVAATRWPDPGYGTTGRGASTPASPCLRPDQGLRVGAIWNSRRGRILARLRCGWRVGSEHPGYRSHIARPGGLITTINTILDAIVAR